MSATHIVKGLLHEGALADTVPSANHPESEAQSLVTGEEASIVCRWGVHGRIRGAEGVCQLDRHPSDPDTHGTRHLQSLRPS